LYAVLVGAAQYLQHFHDIKPRHNAVLQYHPSEGFNNGGLGALRCVVETRNGVGMAAGPVLLNYGAAYNLGRKHVAPGVFAGALDQLFKSQETRLSGEAKKNIEKKEIDDKEAEEELEMAAEAKKKADAEAAAAQKAAAEKKEKEAQEERARNEAQEKKKENVHGADAESKRPKIEVGLCSLQDVVATLKLRSVAKDQYQLIIASDKEINQKIPKDAVLLQVVQGACSRKAGAIFPWESEPKTRVLYDGHAQKPTLQTWARVLSMNPACKAVYGCVPHVGTKQSWKTDFDGTRGFVPSDKMTVPVRNAVQLASGLKYCAVYWRVRLNKDNIMEPKGLVIVSHLGQKGLPAKGELILE
jgi:hypothetical protein